MSIFGHAPHRPLGLALGSGSARGYAHIGVLAVLEEAGIRPDVIAGTSAGAVIGALSAAGYSAADMEQIVRGLDMRQLLHLAGIRRSTKYGALSLAGLESFLRDLLPARFSDLCLPFTCVSTDVRNGGVRVVHTDGDLVSALRASIAVPGVIAPVQSEGRLLVDGGLVEPVPIDAVRALGARRVLAVSVSAVQVGSALDGTPPAGSGWLAKLQPGARGQLAMAAIDVMQHQIAMEAMTRADVVIEPEISAYTQLAFQEAEAIIEAGVAATVAKLPVIREAAGTRHVARRQ